jgi:hypothetical protein
MNAGGCPFRPGDTVRYWPSERGHNLDVMSSERLTPGQTYTVAAIQQDNYVVVEGDTHPGGGIFWTEFRAT